MSRCHTIFAYRRNIHPELTVWGLQHPFLVNFGTSLCLTMITRDTSPVSSAVRSPARQVRFLMVSFRDGPPRPRAYGVDRKDPD
ncbi:hypothetical protein C8J57DRAFT_1503249 [Mycena rebaudengoi]|nr:hypothetical protein C8J57DRAFT_1503249 [Mycena rebaudengoi]